MGRAGSLVGHDALGSGDDGDAQAAEHAGQLVGADVDAEAGLGDAAKTGDDTLFAGVVLQSDVDHALEAVVHHGEALDVALIQQDLSDALLHVGGGIQGRRDRAIFLRRCGVWLLVWTVDRIIAVALRCAWYGVCILWCDQLPDHVAIDRFRALWISWNSVFYDRDQCQLFAFRVLRVVSRPNDRVFQI